LDAVCDGDGGDLRRLLDSLFGDSRR
jgi:hypothetical protein